MAKARAARASPWPVFEEMLASASVQACARARSPSWLKKPAPKRRPGDCVVMVLAALPEGEQRAAALRGFLGVALDRGHMGEAGGDVHRDVVVAHLGGCGQRGREHPPSRAQLALGGVDLPEDAVCDPDRGVRVDQLPAEPQRLRPLAALAQHVDDAGHAGNLGARLVDGAAELQGGVERPLGAAVVGRVVEHDAQPLVQLGRDGRQVVLEGEREASCARSPAPRRTRPAWPSPPRGARARALAGPADPPARRP